MDDDFIVLRPSETDDPGGAKLRGALSAHYGLEHARARRLGVVYLLAGLGLALWVSTAWPRLVPASFRVFTLAAFAAALVGLLLAIGAELRWQRRRASFMSGFAPDSAARAPVDRPPRNG